MTRDDDNGSPGQDFVDREELARRGSDLDATASDATTPAVVADRREAASKGPNRDGDLRGDDADDGDRLGDETF